MKAGLIITVSAVCVLLIFTGPVFSQAQPPPIPCIAFDYGLRQQTRAQTLPDGTTLPQVSDALGWRPDDGTTHFYIRTYDPHIDPLFLAPGHIGEGRNWRNDLCTLTKDSNVVVTLMGTETPNQFGVKQHATCAADDIRGPWISS